MATHSAPNTDTKPRFGVWLPIGTAALLGATMVFVLPQVFYAPEGSSREARLADMARVLPAIVTWCLTGTVLVVSLLIAACSSLVAMSTTLKERPRARVSVLAIFTLLAGGYFLYDVFWREEKAAALRVFFDLLGERDERLSGVYSGARVMGGLGASVSILVVGAAWTLSSWTSGLGVAELRRRGRTLASLLGLVSIGLASGSIATSARLQLQIDPSLSPEALVSAHDVAAAVTVGYGGFFTLILLAVFLPSAWVLRTAGDSLARTANPGSSAQEQQRWLTDQGLASSVPARLMSALAALAPLLSSALSSTIAKAFTAAAN